MASNKSKSGRSTTAWQGAEASAQKEEYFTPGGYELEKILNRGSAVYTRVNEVWPNVYIGDE